MKNKIITGLVTIGLSCFLVSQAYAFHGALDMEIWPDKHQERAKKQGLVLISTLYSSAGFQYRNWDHLTLVKDGDLENKTDTKLVKCFGSLCLHYAKLEAGSYQILELLNRVENHGYMTMVTTTTVPALGLGKFTVESQKLTNLGILGIYMKSEAYSGLRDQREMGFYADFLSPLNSEYLSKATSLNLKFPEGDVLGWDPDSAFARVTEGRSLFSPLFQDISRTVQHGKGDVYFPTNLGDIYTLDGSTRFNRLEAGTDLRLHAVYKEQDFYLLGGEAGKLYLYKPGQGEAKLIHEFGVDDLVADILKYEDKYYAVVLSGISGLTGNSKGAVYRFALDNPNFEELTKLPTVYLSWRASYKGYAGYKLKTLNDGFLLRLKKDELEHFDFKSGKLQKMELPYPIEDFSVADDRSLIIVSEEEKRAVTKTSGKSDPGEAQLQELPKRDGKGKTTSKGVSVLMLSKDWQQWETMAMLSGQITSNVCFADSKTAYLVLRREVFHAKKETYEYAPSQLFKTEDGGYKWQEVGSAGAMPDSNFQLLCQGKLILIDKDGPAIRISEDSGKTWNTTSLFGIASAWRMLKQAPVR